VATFRLLQVAKSCFPLQIGYSDSMAVNGVPEHGSLTACRDFDWREGLFDRLVVLMAAVGF
jgi:hypothetical protein